MVKGISDFLQGFVGQTNITLSERKAAQLKADERRATMSDQFTIWKKQNDIENQTKSAFEKQKRVESQEEVNRILGITPATQSPTGAPKEQSLTDVAPTASTTPQSEISQAIQTNDLNKLYEIKKRAALGAPDNKGLNEYIDTAIKQAESAQKDVDIGRISPTAPTDRKTDLTLKREEEARKYSPVFADTVTKINLKALENPDVTLMSPVYPNVPLRSGAAKTLIPTADAVGDNAYQALKKIKAKAGEDAPEQAALDESKEISHKLIKVMLPDSTVTSRDPAVTTPIVFKDGKYYKGINPNFKGQFPLEERIEAAKELQAIIDAGKQDPSKQIIRPGTLPLNVKMSIKALSQMSPDSAPVTPEGDIPPPPFPYQGPDSAPTAPRTGSLVLEGPKGRAIKSVTITPQTPLSYWEDQAKARGYSVVDTIMGGEGQ